MKFNDYIGIGPDEFKIRYIDPGYVQVAHHKEFPLSIYTYGRKTVHENLWDAVTSKCRGIIVNRETGDVVARPFEKFHNYGGTLYQGDLDRGQLYVWEKMDGFLITGYCWAGEWYAASKGSFHSIHAKWATRVLQALNLKALPQHDWTPIFEGLHPSLRIVVDYGKREELVMLALIHIESGMEVYPDYLRHCADELGCTTPRSFDLTLDTAVKRSYAGTSNEEGYVLTWYRPPQQSFRLKLKFVDYLRLHRMVTGVSPKRIWECLASGSSEIKDYISQSTPWFAAFTQKWVRALTEEYQRLKTGAEERYAIAKLHIDRLKFEEPFANLGAERKAWALEFQKPAYEGYQSILFGMLDNKPLDRLYWNQVKHMTSGANPMVDAHNT